MFIVHKKPVAMSLQLQTGIIGLDKVVHCHCWVWHFKYTRIGEAEMDYLYCFRLFCSMFSCFMVIQIYIVISYFSALSVCLILVMCMFKLLMMCQVCVSNMTNAVCSYSIMCRENMHLSHFILLLCYSSYSSGPLWCAINFHFMDILRSLFYQLVSA